jgi:hypothetical protein
MESPLSLFGTRWKSLLGKVQTMTPLKPGPTQISLSGDCFGSSVSASRSHGVVGNHLPVEGWEENARVPLGLEAAAVTTLQGYWASGEFLDDREDVSRATRKKWLEDAIGQLADLDADAREDGLEPPSAKARDLARKFMRELAKYDLPLATVSADEDRGVSIQMEVTGFFFLLTCFGDGTGLFNVARPTHRFEGPFGIPQNGSVAESEFMQDLRCLIRPLKNHAGHADRPK